MIIDCLSDLHGYYPELDGGDLLLLCGDYTASDRLPQWAEFFNWLNQQKYRKKILIAGNHDNFLSKGFPTNQKEANDLKDVLEFLGEEDCDFEYLCDSGTEFEGLKIWGSPWSTLFPGINIHCTAFTGTSEFVDQKFESIPTDVDILMTHMPPYGMFDMTRRKTNVGSKQLREITTKTPPRIHVFGHIHEQGGKTLDASMTRYVNASYVNENYEPVNKPLRIII